MELEGGARGFVTLASTRPGGPPTVIAFESKDDAAGLAAAWAASGAADGPAGAPLEAVIGMAPDELAGHLDAAGAAGAVVRAGVLALAPGGDATALIDALYAAAAGQRADDVLDMMEAEADEEEGRGGVWDV